jgi:predicted membrane protein (TIGR00267 family)
MAKQSFQDKITAVGPFLRDIIFGAHDALLTNIGIVTGFVAALQDSRLIIMAALIDVFISAFAMAFGTYLSRTSETEYLEGQLDTEKHTAIQDVMANPIIAAVVMWVTYVVTGFIPLIPFFFPIEPAVSMRYGVALAMIIFFVVGALKGMVTKTNPWKSGLQFLSFGAFAGVVGYLIGTYGQQYFR